MNHSNQTISKVVPYAIIFYDGECPLCNRFVRLLINLDRDSKLRFAPLEGKTAQNLIPNKVKEKNSIVFLCGNKIYERSQAIFRAIMHLAPKWKILHPFLLIPKRWADWVYDIVARNRYRLFSSGDRCSVMDTPKDIFLE